MISYWDVLFLLLLSVWLSNVANGSFREINGLNKFEYEQKDNQLYFDTPSNYYYQAMSWSAAGKVLDKYTVDLVSTSNISVQRTMTGSGMHREILTSLIVKIKEKDLYSDMCFALFAEQVSQSFFLDIYELERRNIFQLYYNSSIDIEKTAYESVNHTLLIIKDLVLKDNYYEATYKLPWHVRYHQPSNEGYINLILPAPKVYLLCNGSNVLQENDLSDDENNFVLAPCPSMVNEQLCSSLDSCKIGKKLCIWAKTSDIPSNGLLITWPVGIISHQCFVTLATLALIFFGTYSILYSVVKRPP